MAGVVEAATRRQLRAAGILLGEWGLASAAVQLAKRLDQTADAGKYAAGMRELRQALDRLDDLRSDRPPAALPDGAADVEPAGDVMDELAVRRDRPVS